MNTENGLPMEVAHFGGWSELAEVLGTSRQNLQYRAKNPDRWPYLLTAEEAMIASTVPGVDGKKLSRRRMRPDLPW